MFTVVDWCSTAARRSSSEHTNAAPVGCDLAARLRGKVYVVVHFIYHNSVFEVSGTLVARCRLLGENVSGWYHHRGTQ